MLEWTHEDLDQSGRISFLYAECVHRAESLSYTGDFVIYKFEEVRDVKEDLQQFDILSPV
jgi:hypothetical protein